MPAGPRIRDNNVFGVTTDNPLTAGAGTFNSAGLANMSVVASAHAMVTLDPIRQFGEPEIVVVTAHTALATVATITRGQYGTTARAHPQGTLWVHQPIDEDFIEILTSATRPTNPYRGQMIFETDTDSYVGRDVADVWQTALPLGAWLSWSPSYTNLTIGGGTVSAKYTRLGRMIAFRFRFAFGAGSAVGGDPTFTLPVTPATTYAVSASQGDSLGSVRIIDLGTADFSGQAFHQASGVCAPKVGTASGTFTSFAGLNAASPMTWAIGDVLMVDGLYEAAN